MTDLYDIAESAIDSVHDMDVTHADYARAVVDAVLAELPKWQPIETAPKDGTDILLGSTPQEYKGKLVPARVTVGHWASEDECRVHLGDCGGPCRCHEFDHTEAFWMSWDGGFTEENPPSHWMPLPDAPRGGAA